jgi:hypothetical protein
MGALWFGCLLVLAPQLIHQLLQTVRKLSLHGHVLGETATDRNTRCTNVLVLSHLPFSCEGQRSLRAGRSGSGRGNASAAEWNIRMSGQIVAQREGG